MSCYLSLSCRSRRIETLSVSKPASTVHLPRKFILLNQNLVILHMGGIFEGKAETLDRFRKHYADLSPGVKKRLVLENDDVCWTVHDLLPVCEE